ncbi:tyrosine-type recombinase/integrase [Neopusillimonas maritima]|uniref:Integrase n=1 Tax=Neopusillimonas maritima TaxID=2026239 RepID=A0ABX9N0B1_9BURK|nr:tyrosine-type recombinase/integrase [Neopusillimonas maritima]RII84628.1 integrase [Neopusillimonas maritima]
MVKITDRQAQAIKPGGKAIPAGVTGLTLQPGKTAGSGKWTLRFVSPVTGKRRDMGLGAYPDTGVAEAIASALAARQQIASGVDPIEAKKELSEIPTFEAASRKRWDEVKKGFRNEKHITQWIGTLEQHVFPHIGTVKVDKLDPRRFADVLRPIWLTIPETARRVKQRCADVMAWAWAHGYVTSNPLDVTDRLLAAQPTPTNHQPAMPWAQVGSFVRASLMVEPLLGARAALLFVILTAARSGEVRAATWEEIDLDAKLWTVPAGRMKANMMHRVPLSDAAVDLLQRQGERKAGQLVFPSMRGKELSDMALTVLLRKAQAVSDVPGRVATAHGFRSSFRDWAADNGYGKDIAERALAHVIGNKTQRAYERTDLFDARRTMMQNWSNFVFSDQSNVVPINQKTGTNGSRSYLD